MSITFFSEEIPFTLRDKTKIRNWIENSILNEKCQLGDLNFIFTSDEYLLKINKEYLSHDYYTDIITFNYCQGDLISGDIFISIDTVKNNSERFNVTFIDELHRVIIHGVLHLVGYDDKNEDQQKVMTQKENEYLERFKNLL
ncbi:MAG: rRNA maturation RNase YbeY [Bacteroidales bacterium]|nr:rRNA maturation RNase YbeY [Bacteroidales bacterium]